MVSELRVFTNSAPPTPANQRILFHTFIWYFFWCGTCTHIVVASLGRYWEIIEAFRRIILTAVLSICFPGTNGQSVLAVFAVCTFLKMYQIYQPYRDSEDNAIAEIGQWQLLLTFFCGLLLQASVLDSGWQYGIGLSLVLASFAVLAITLYFQVRLHLRARKVSGDD